MPACIHPLILAKSVRVGPGGYIYSMVCQYCGQTTEQVSEYQNPGGPWYSDPAEAAWGRDGGKEAYVNYISLALDGRYDDPDWVGYIGRDWKDSSQWNQPE